MTNLLVFTNLPDEASARRLAEALVDARLAACVNVLAACRSIYRWDGKVEHANEVPVLIKTREDRYGELEAAIRANHPYELPEIIAVRIERGLPEYLNWIGEEVKPTRGS
jgi:periplasmic divalent cation tolerance protein